MYVYTYIIILAHAQEQNTVPCMKQKYILNISPPASIMASK